MATHFTKKSTKQTRKAAAAPEVRDDITLESPIKSVASVGRGDAKARAKFARAFAESKLRDAILFDLASASEAVHAIVHGKNAITNQSLALMAALAIDNAGQAIEEALCDLGIMPEGEDCLYAERLRRDRWLKEEANHE